MEAFLREWGYLGIFLGILATGLGFPMPEELPIVLGGALVGGEHAHWYFMLPICIVGVIIGDSFLYFIGRFWGARLVELSFIKKHILTPERLQKITENFQEYGIRILLFARLTPGIRAPIFLTAGITRLSLARFILADGIYAIPGVSLLFLLGYAFTDQMVRLIQEEAGKVKSIIIIVVIAAVVLYFAYKMFKRPVITGDPHEMPKLVEQMTDTLDLTSKIMKQLPPPKPSENHQAGATEHVSPTRVDPDKTIPG
ncbi:MAG: DedA family protein [Gemmataceae bacterium]|nr:DedA family protein [Gemmataceae bacterium]